MQVTIPLGRSRAAEQLHRALEGRLPADQLTPTIGGYAAVAERLGELVPTTSLRPSPEYRAELHGRLLELATQISPARSAERAAAPGRATQASDPAERGRRSGRLEPAWFGAGLFRRGWRRTAAATTGALLTLMVGVGLAAGSALPGGLLYPVKELIQSAQVQLASGDLARGKVLLDQAAGHIDDAQTLVSNGSPDAADVDTALRSAGDDLGQANGDLMSHFGRTQDPAALTALARFASSQSPVLAQLRGRVPVGSEPLVDSLLSRLGAVADTVRASAAQCGAPCASVPVVNLPGSDGLPAGTSGTSGAGSTAGGSDGSGSGLGGLLDPSGPGLGTGAGTGGAGPGGLGGAGSGSASVSVGGDGVGVQLPGVGASVPAPGVTVGSGGVQATVPPVGVHVGGVTATLPGVGVSVPPLLPSSPSTSAPAGSSSSSSLCLLIVCVG